MLTVDNNNVDVEKHFKDLFVTLIERFILFPKNNMTPESIVTSLEWSKKIKQAGWPQKEALWFWVHHYRAASDEYLWELFERDEDDKVNEHLAAPTAEEILRKLPEEYVAKDGKRLELSCGKKIKQHGLGYYVTYETPREPHDCDEACCTNDKHSLANAAAAMYCYLAENNLLKND